MGQMIATVFFLVGLVSSSAAAGDVNLDEILRRNEALRHEELIQILETDRVGLVMKIYFIETYLTAGIPNQEDSTKVRMGNGGILQKIIQIMKSVGIRNAEKVAQKAGLKSALLMLRDQIPNLDGGVMGRGETNVVNLVLTQRSKEEPAANFEIYEFLRKHIAGKNSQDLEADLEALNSKVPLRILSLPKNRDHLKIVAVTNNSPNLLDFVRKLEGFGEISERRNALFLSDQAKDVFENCPTQECLNNQLEWIIDRIEANKERTGKLPFSRRAMHAISGDPELKDLTRKRDRLLIAAKALSQIHERFQEDADKMEIPNGTELETYAEEVQAIREVELRPINNGRSAE